MEIRTDVLVIGAGIAGLVAAYECLQRGQRVCIIERQAHADIGGLARWAFGGMALIDTPLQRRMKIRDSAELAWRDWCQFAEFSEQDTLPKAWGQYYVEHSRREVFDYLSDKKLRFFPAVNWVERGLVGNGNSVPRYHVLWGTGQRLVDVFMGLLAPFEASGRLQIWERTRCTELITETMSHGPSDHLVDGQRVTGCIAITEGESDGAPCAKTFLAGATIVATGGINGSLERVRQNLPDLPSEILNGAHPASDGHVHDCVQAMGGALTHLDKMWNYAAGIPHPQPKFAGHGLSLIPCKSALWLDHTGRRIGPEPLVTGFDTHDLCQRVSALAEPYTWQVLNWRIAAKEFAVSGSEHNVALRERQLGRFLREVLLGNHALIKQMQAESDHFIVADNVSELCAKMNALNGNQAIALGVLSATLQDFDAQIARGASLWNDDQLRRIQHARAWRSDKVRTCKPKPLLDRKHGPLIAIKCRLISRKSLGGIVSDLNSRVVNVEGQAIDQLYAVGEAAGFGGGGASGKRSLEGTFLSACLMTAQAAARHIGQQA